MTALELWKLGIGLLSDEAIIEYYLAVINGNGEACFEPVGIGYRLVCPPNGKPSTIFQKETSLKGLRGLGFGGDRLPATVEEFIRLRP